MISFFSPLTSLTDFATIHTFTRRWGAALFTTTLQVTRGEMIVFAKLSTKATSVSSSVSAVADPTIIGSRFRLQDLLAG